MSRLAMLTSADDVEAETVTRALRDAEAANRRLRLLWIGCGSEDSLIEPARGLHEKLTAHKVQHVWFEGPGSHEWQVWRKHLQDFAPRLFQSAK